MSSDNFWYVKGNRVYMGDASHFAEMVRDAEEAVEAVYKSRLVKRDHPFHKAETHKEAVEWAKNEYAEYGTYWIDE